MSWTFGPTVDGDVVTFALEIDDIEELYVAPKMDLFSERPNRYMGRSVLEMVVDFLENEKWLNRKTHRLVLSMPREKIAPDLSKRCEAALDRYCAMRIKHNQFHKAALRRKGLLQVPYAMAFLIATMGLGILFGSELVPGISSWLAVILSEGFFIIGWVALWGPADSLLFARFPLIWNNRALRALERVEVEVRPRG